ncbi:MAG: hypothetical protein RLZZ455_141, partial [Candidatus Parcubacteria bacterium]
VSYDSTDNTVQVAKSIKNKKIIVKQRKKRKGLNETENFITRSVKSDYLILLDADVLPKDEMFLQQIFQTFKRSGSIGIVGVKIVPLKPKTVLERILVSSHYFKESMYKRIKHGDNIYLCHGRARGFSKAFYSKVKWPVNVPEDAYSYLFCKKLGMKFVYNKSAVVYFRTPSTIEDQVKQSKRFTYGVKQLSHIFPGGIVEREFSIPAGVVTGSIIRFIMYQPLTAITYIGLLLYIHFFTRVRNQALSSYEASSTTKRLINTIFAF